jgi:hypothetical protein
MVNTFKFPKLLLYVIMEGHRSVNLIKNSMPILIALNIKSNSIFVNTTIDYDKRKLQIGMIFIWNWNISCTLTIYYS